MKLFLITQSINNGYDTYRGAVVAAESVNDAKTIHPDGESKISEDADATWVDDVAQVHAQEIGTARKGVKRGVVCADFNGDKYV